MRLLLPHPRADMDVHEHYAGDWVARGGIRANMIASADGAAAAHGLTAGLQTPGDNRVFAALRDLADVVVVGWATAHAEGYRPVTTDELQVARRAEYGLAPWLPLAVITRSLAIDPSAPVLDRTDSEATTLIVTCARSDPARRAALARVADVLVCGDDDIDYTAVRRELAARGLPRVLCEGGPTILNRLLCSGELDELCVSVTPLLAGPGAVRIVAGEPWPQTRPMRLHSLLEEDGALFARYRGALS